MIFKKLILFLFILTLSLSNIGTASEQCFSHLLTTQNKNNGTAITALPEQFDFQVVGRFPHDPSAFTQGLVFYKEFLFESTGLLNKSAVSKINVKNGNLLLKTHIPDIYFGEGLTVLNHQIVQMSWKTGKVFFFHPETLSLIKKQDFEMDVWGVTTINNQLVISNGSSNLLFLSSENLSINKTLKITFHNMEILGLNELEYVEGYIYANVWPTNCIVIIDPINGSVLGWLNLSNLYPTEYQLPDSAVLNGIAYHRQNKNLFVTGKFWPYLYEINLQPNEH